ncbi:MAG: hypothetical protein ACRAVC_11345 [Trichormus sp.]
MGLGIALKTVARMQDLVSRLYEQGADEFRIEMYVRRWWLWVKGGVQGIVDFLGCDRISYGAIALRSRTLQESRSLYIRGDRISLTHPTLSAYARSLLVGLPHDSL